MDNVTLPRRPVMFFNQQPWNRYITMSIFLPQMLKILAVNHLRTMNWSEVLFTWHLCHYGWPKKKEWCHLSSWFYDIDSWWDVSKVNNSLYLLYHLFSGMEISTLIILMSFSKLMFFWSLQHSKAVDYLKAEFYLNYQT